MAPAEVVQTVERTMEIVEVTEHPAIVVQSNEDDPENMEPMQGHCRGRAQEREHQKPCETAQAAAAKGGA
jgi:hypothetical protein